MSPRSPTRCRSAAFSIPDPYTPEQNGNREAGFVSYLPIRQNAPVAIAKAGTKIPVAGLEVHIVSSAGDLTTAPLPGVRRATNPLCANALRKAQDATPNNYESIGVVVEYGRFRYLDLADLTWNQEVELVCPNNLLGLVSVYRTSRHGGDYSGAQALVHSVRPRIAIMNNNPTKGGTPGHLPHRQGLARARGLLAAPLLRQRDQGSELVRAAHCELHRAGRRALHQALRAQRRQFSRHERPERVLQGISGHGNTSGDLEPIRAVWEPGRGSEQRPPRPIIR